MLATGLLLAVVAPQTAAASAHDADGDPGADVTYFSSESAVARWALGDDRNTQVTVAAFDGEFHHPPDEPSEREQVLVGVHQSFCDEPADELVHRTWVGVDRGSVEIDSLLLSEATADAALTLHGYQRRVPNCDDPDHDSAQSQPLQDDVEIAGEWEGDDGRQRSVSSYTFVGEGYVYHANDAGRARDAHATGTLHGLGDDGIDADLSSTHDADLVSSNTSRISVRS